MKSLPFVFCTLLLAIATAPSARAQTSTAAIPAQALPAVSVETIVMIRHGEKPPADQGQITFQGLNRALALPDVLIGKYGRADFVFAPGTQHTITRNGVKYSYIRPLITIEPTAIRLGLPVSAEIPFDDIGALQVELLRPIYRNSLIFVAWEHHMLEQFVKNVVTESGGDPKTVPDWAWDDFDSIYVLKIRTEGEKKTITFQHDHEGLDGQSPLQPEPRKTPAPLTDTPASKP